MSTNEVAAGANRGASENAVHAAKLNTSEDSTSANERKKSWRDVIRVHPAADLFPLMSKDELKALGKDIKKYGLKNRVHFIKGEDGEELLDGRNRLDAMEQEGLLELPLDGKVASWAHCADCKTGFDPYAYVISANILRRHLTADQKRDLIAKLIKEKPEKSDRQIAETVKASPTTVGKVRAEVEPTVQSGQLKRVGKDGKARKQPVRQKPKPPQVSEEVLQYRAAAAERIRALMGGAVEQQPEPEMAAHNAEMDPEISAAARKTAYAADEEAAAIATAIPADIVPMLDAVIDGPASTNPITAAWDKASEVQRLVFVRERKNDIENHRYSDMERAIVRAQNRATAAELEDGIPPFLRRTAS